MEQKKPQRAFSLYVAKIICTIRAMYQSFSLPELDNLHERTEATATAQDGARHNTLSKAAQVAILIAGSIAAGNVEKDMPGGYSANQAGLQRQDNIGVMHAA